MAALALGARPAEAAPFVYVANASAATVSVVDRALNSVVATVPVGQSPRGVAITPNGKFVYVTNWAAPGSVSVIATASNTVVSHNPRREFPMAWPPRRMGSSPM